MSAPGVIWDPVSQMVSELSGQLESHGLPISTCTIGQAIREHRGAVFSAYAAGVAASGLRHSRDRLEGDVRLAVDRLRRTTLQPKAQACELAWLVGSGQLALVRSLVYNRS